MLNCFAAKVFVAGVEYPDVDAISLWQSHSKTHQGCLDMHVLPIEPLRHSGVMHNSAKLM
jgi:hypothetical protein